MSRISVPLCTVTRMRSSRRPEATQWGMSRPSPGVRGACRASRPAEHALTLRSLLTPCPYFLSHPRRRILRANADVPLARAIEMPPTVVRNAVSINRIHRYRTIYRVIRCERATFARREGAGQWAIPVQRQRTALAQQLPSVRRGGLTRNPRRDTMALWISHMPLKSTDDTTHPTGAGRCGAAPAGGQ